MKKVSELDMRTVFGGGFTCHYCSQKFESSFWGFLEALIHMLKSGHAKMWVTW